MSYSVMAAWLDDQYPYPPDVLARFEPNTTTDECFICRPSRTKKNELLERCRWMLDETAEFPVCDKHTSAEAYRSAQSLIYSKRYKRGEYESQISPSKLCLVPEMRNIDMQSAPAL